MTTETGDAAGDDVDEAVAEQEPPERDAPSPVLTLLPLDGTSCTVDGICN